MELEDSGQHQNHCSHHNSRSENERGMGRLRPYAHFCSVNTNSSFSSFQMIFRKRRRDERMDDGGNANSCPESHRCHPHHKPPRHHHYTTLFPSSPLVLLTTSLLFLLCLAPLCQVYSLPFDSRGSSLGIGGGGYRSQMDLLIDPIHQAEFGDEPLESKRVVAKSVFDMVLRTPPPPTSSSSRCPPGTQSPFEGGPCIKKSTDPVALVDQSFLLDALRGLAKDGVLLSTGPTKQRKRRPGRPGGSSRTTPTPTTPSPPMTSTTETVMTSAMESTPPTSGDNTEFMEGITAEPSPSNMQPVFEEEPSKLPETLMPSTLPTTTPEAGTAPEDLTTSSWNGHERRRNPSRTPSPRPENDNGEQITIATTPISTSKLPTSSEQSVAEVAATATSAPAEQEKSGQDHQLPVQEPLIATTHSSSSSDNGVDVVAGSQISPEITGMSQVEKDDSQTNKLSMTTMSTPEDISSPQPTFPQALTADEDSMISDKDMIQTSTASVILTPTSPSSWHTTDINIVPSGASALASGSSAPDEEMTGVTTSSSSPSASLELADADETEEKETASPVAPSTSSEKEVGNADDKLMANRMIKAKEEDDEKWTPLPAITTLSTEVGIRTSEPTPVTDNSVDGVSFLDGDGETEQPLQQLSPQEPINLIQPEVESKVEGVTGTATITETEQVEPLRQEEQVEEGKGEVMMGDMSMTARVTGTTEEREGVIEEGQAEPGDGQPSSILPVVNHWTDSASSPNDEEKGAAMLMMMTTTPLEKEVRDDDDLVLVNNPLISLSQTNEMNKAGEIGITTPSSPSEKDGGDHDADGNSSSSRENKEDFTNVARDQEDQPQLLKEDETRDDEGDSGSSVTSFVPTEPTIPSSSLFQHRPESTLLQFQLPIVTTNPNHLQTSREEGVANGFEKFPEFPSPSSKIRFPSSSGSVELPVEGGSAVRGTSRPIFVQDFQLDYPPLKSQEPPREQQWQSPKPFLLPLQKQSISSGPAAEQTTQPEYYDSGSTEYLESELDRRHQKTRSRNRIRTQEPFPSTTQPLPLDLSFYSQNPHPYRHLPTSSHNSRQSQPQSSSPASSQQPYYFARRSPTPDYLPYGYLNFRPGHDRFQNNNRRLIW